MSERAEKWAEQGHTHIYEQDIAAQGYDAGYDAAQAELRAPMECGHLKACWIEGAHTPHDGDVVHKCGADCQPDYCAVCTALAESKAEIARQPDRIAKLNELREIEVRKQEAEWWDKEILDLENYAPPSLCQQRIADLDASANRIRTEMETK